MIFLLSCFSFVRAEAEATTNVNNFLLPNTLIMMAVGHRVSGCVHCVDVANSAGHGDLFFFVRTSQTDLFPFVFLLFLILSSFYDATFRCSGCRARLCIARENAKLPTGHVTNDSAVKGRSLKMPTGPRRAPHSMCSHGREM